MKFLIIKLASLSYYAYPSLVCFISLTLSFFLQVWGHDALVHMIELYLNPDQDGAWEVTLLSSNDFSIIVHSTIICVEVHRIVQDFPVCSIL